MEENKGATPSFGLYVHVPYCAHRCGYCDFYAAGSRLADWSAYRRALAAELEARLEEMRRLRADRPSFRTLYFGGGTPSLIPAGEFLLLAGRINEILGFPDWREVTVEANPDDVTPEKADAWLQAGVDRVSLGVQSFSAQELLRLDRRHNPGHVEMALEVLRQRFSNVSIDLIFGIPGQTLQDWERTLERALELRPSHLSAYSLSYEERSLLTELRRQGRIGEIGEEEMEAMYAALRNRLSEAGYEHYEVSNFSLPGFRSLHNSSYWQGLPYIGLGPSAASYDGLRTRRTNRPSLRRWLEAPSTEYDEETLDQEELLTERLMTRLRTDEGLDMERYSLDFGQQSAQRLKARAARFLANGTMTLDSAQRLKARAARFLADGTMTLESAQLKVPPASWPILDWLLTQLL